MLPAAINYSGDTKLLYNAK